MSSEKDNLINIVDEMKSLGLYNPKDRFDINSAALAIQSLRQKNNVSRNKDLLDKLPNLQRSIQRYPGDIPFYTHKNDFKKFIKIFQESKKAKTSEEHYIKVIERVLLTDKKTESVSEYDREKKLKKIAQQNKENEKRRRARAKKRESELNNIDLPVEELFSPRELCFEMGLSKRFVPFANSYAQYQFDKQIRSRRVDILVLKKKKSIRQGSPYSFIKTELERIKKGIKKFKKSQEKWLTLNMALQKMDIGANAKNRRLLAQYCKERLALQEQKQNLDVYTKGERAHGKQKHSYSMSNNYLKEIRQDLHDKKIFILKKSKTEHVPLKILYTLGYSDTRENRKNIYAFIKKQFLENNTIIVERLSGHNKVLCVDDADLEEINQLIEKNKVALKRKKVKKESVTFNDKLVA